MKKLLLSLFFLLPAIVNAQTYKQYFDGADTLGTSFIGVQLDTAGSNVWQIGKPQKQIFDSAATQPNALITDTINTYPVNNVSRAMFELKSSIWGSWGILAIRWKQKLDLDTGTDGGIVEFSMNNGVNWNNAFTSSSVYNFYGFNNANKDTLPGGEYAFTGTDSTWRDIWLCFDNSFLGLNDSVLIRYTLKTDSVDKQKEGWIIDNLTAHKTWVHTVKKMEDNQYLRVYPTQTSGIVNIEAQKLQEFHIIKNMQLMDMQGRIVEEFGASPTKYSIDIGRHADGVYWLKVNTNKRSEIFIVVLKR